MASTIQEKIQQIFDSIEIKYEYSSDVTRIETFNWNGELHDFKVEYFIGSQKYVFHYDREEVKNLGVKTNPIEQLEDEVRYVKRMHERGIGSKDYYPFTTI
ncbi:hypothetical protein [Bacillus suaedaesalsae]|uniref:KTSC domain-containing protein n=1 Tax=Bacillus suaedaesalsae TaxID=2810349 RepID=A0ABS2DDS5_9BACI|nr:hypothetical protein [Bacillus suaedaesalsae]MBM6616611.1 hypothetical protein [Bacillus suaedaesalsae]